MVDKAPTVTLPKATLAGGGRVAWSVLVGYARLLCHVIGVGALGLALNWGILVLRWVVMPPEGVAAKVGLIVVFGVALPAAYIVVGHKQGVQALLRHCYQRHHSSLMDCTLLLLQRVAVSQVSVTADSIRSALKRVDEMSWPIRFALRQCLRNPDFAMLAAEIIGDADFRAGNLAATKERYAARVNECVLRSMLDVNTRWFWALMVANVAAIAITWLLI
jgi:hypothetical protein